MIACHLTFTKVVVVHRAHIVTTYFRSRKEIDAVLTHERTSLNDVITRNDFIFRLHLLFLSGLSSVVNRRPSSVTRFCLTVSDGTQFGQDSGKRSDDGIGLMVRM